MLQILDTGKNTAEKNMLLDGELLKNLGGSPHPILHFYDWEGDSLTYGYFLKPEKLLDLEELRKRNISLARRPTGGGVVFHIWDLAFSFLMPSSHPGFSINPLENYHFVNQIVLKAMEDFIHTYGSMELIGDHFPKEIKASEHFCMARPTKYDVVMKGVKIAGAAQRLTKAGYLHQGTISLVKPDRELLLPVLLGRDDLVLAMERHAFCPLQDRIEDLTAARENLKGHLAKRMSLNGELDRLNRKAF